MTFVLLHGVLPCLPVAIEEIVVMKCTQDHPTTHSP